MKNAFFISLFFTFICHAGDWPQWLGPTRDGHAASDEKISPQLPADLKANWKIKIGGGFSSPVVSSNQVLFCDEDGANEIAHLIDAQSGKEIWQTKLAPRFTDEWGAGTRSTPFFDGDRVYAQSCNGEFRCLNRATGKVIWGTSFEKDFGVKFLGSKANEGTAARRGHNGTGVLDGNAVILPVGSTNGATIVCFDKLTGKILWKNGQDETAYSSLQVATLAGRKQVIALTATQLAGFDCATGKQFWRVPLRTSANRHAATPVIVRDNVIVNSHTLGLISFAITKEGENFKATEIWANKNLKINLSTPVVSENALFCQGPNKNFICADVNTGKLLWEAPGFGKENSSTIAIGKNLLVLTDGGELVLVDASSTKYSERGRFQICGKNWNFPAVAGGKLYVRDARELASYDLQQQSVP